MAKVNLTIVVYRFTITAVLLLIAYGVARLFGYKPDVRPTVTGALAGTVLYGIGSTLFRQHKARKMGSDGSDGME